jgi:endonuclease/exonuclease/phosphatase family metal-dependent hydrolase
MDQSDLYSEVRSSIPQISAARLAPILERPDPPTHEEILALVPEIHVIERDNSLAAETPGPPLCVLCWNGERGRFVLEKSPIPSAQIYLLNEMDVGMARTDNIHTIRELAQRLGLNYVFAVEFLELTKGEPHERAAPCENERGLHGNAILTGYEIHRPRLLRLEGGAFWLDHEQKRIGTRTALICDLITPAGSIRAVCTHLESEATPLLRQRQMSQVLCHLDDEGVDIPTVIGGDFNTWTFDKRSEEERKQLESDPETPVRLLRPMEWEPLFEDLTSHGFAFHELNDFSRGTYPVPGFPVEAHLDWITAKGLRVVEADTSPAVIPAPHSKDLGRAVSDHHAVRVCLDFMAR